MNKEKVLVIGSGPIIVGQSCEFDYSGTQACKSLKEMGYYVVLLNNNPATIMTDPNMADSTYMCEMSRQNVINIIKTEKIKYILPIVGGQTALNLVTDLNIESLGVELVGSDLTTIDLCEDRHAFRQAMEEIGIETTKVYNKDNVVFPAVLRKSFELGGTNSTFVNNEKEFKKHYTPDCIIEQNIFGWQELEIEIIRDRYNNKTIVCEIENIDPVGVHTGDSVCVSPFITVSESIKEQIKTYSKEIVEKLNIVGGCNIQYAYNSETNELLVIEVNPRTSRSSALASKATGFPIAYIATKLAMGEEMPNYIKTWEQGHNYYAVKFPRFDNHKFSPLDDKLGITMKATGEVLSFGKTFIEAYKKAVVSLEQNEKLDLSNNFHFYYTSLTHFEIINLLKKSNADNVIDFLHNTLKIHKYFLKEISKYNETNIEQNYWYKVPVINTVDKFYYYGSNILDDSKTIVSPIPTKREKVLVIGSGANRIGQGIEFDYCSVHAVKSLKKLGYQVIMLNCNPETVSTDYDTADKLYFEPITADTIRRIYQKEKPIGLLCQFGGQTSINVAEQLLKDKDINVLDYNEIDKHERDEHIIYDTNVAECFYQINKDFPLIIKKHNIIGGTDIVIVRNKEELKEVLQKTTDNTFPLSIQHYYEDLEEYEADILSDGEDIFVLNVLIQKFQRTGIHSGDSNEFIRSDYSINSTLVKNRITEYLKKRGFNRYKGIFNVQFCFDYDIIDNNPTIIDINNRCSRTVPIMSKVYNFDMVDEAIKIIMLGKKVPKYTNSNLFLKYSVVKVPIFSWNKFPNTPKELSPIMHSTGEIIRIKHYYGNKTEVFSPIQNLFKNNS